MKTSSTFSRIFLSCPWTLLLFLIIPLTVILNLRFQFQLTIMGPRILLANNLCFALLVGCRLLHYLWGGLRDIRYGALPSSRRSAAVYTDDAAVRRILSGQGFRFTEDGNYGEKRDVGYIGTLLFYAGLFLLLTTGCWDNLRHFSGVVYDSLGPMVSLGKKETYRQLHTGPWLPNLEDMPRMQIIRQQLPDAAYPKGATEAAFIDADGKVEKVLLQPGEPVRLGSYDITMAKLVFEPEIVIKAKATSMTVYDDVVRLDPLVQKRGPYSFYGIFRGALVEGGVYYQPEKSTLMMVISRGDSKTVADMTFQVDQQVEQEDYIISCAKMGQWSEINVTRRRHKGLIFVGALTAFAGLLLRLAVRPRRVWLEPAETGYSIQVSDPEILNPLSPLIRH